MAGTVLGTLFGNTVGIGSLTPIGTGLAVNIPLLTATAGTFATPLAVLGIIKLGAALAIALGFIAVGIATNGNDDDQGYSSGGYSSGGSSGGYSSGGSSGYGRHRRQVTEAVPEIHAPSQEALFSLISAMDTYGCGKQLICELEARNPATLASDEAIMLRLFSNKTHKKVSVADPKAEYEIAAELGREAKSKELCRNRYSTCTYTGEEMMTALRNSQL